MTTKKPTGNHVISPEPVRNVPWKGAETSIYSFTRGFRVKIIDSTTYYTTKEVAAITGITWSIVKRRCLNGEIPTFVLNGRYLISEDTITKKTGLERRNPGRPPKHLAGGNTSPEASRNLTVSPTRSPNTVTSKSNSTVTPSTPPESSNGISLIETIRRLADWLFTKDTNSPLDTRIPKALSDAQCTTSLTSWSRTKTGQRKL
jgi:hypothetical protein